MFKLVAAALLASLPSYARAQNNGLPSLTGDQRALQNCIVYQLKNGGSQGEYAFSSLVRQNCGFNEKRVYDECMRHNVSQLSFLNK